MSVNRSRSGEDHEDAVLITGGSGFVGKKLVKVLSDANKSIVSIYHHRFTEPMANVYPVCSDLSSTELLAAPLRGVSTVVYLAWEHNFLGPSEGLKFDPISKKGSKNIFLLNNMIKAMEKAGTRRIIFLSAVGASDSSNNSFLREKYFAEFCILNSAIPEKVIIRSSIIIGSDIGEDRFLRSITGLMRFPWICPIPSSKNSISPISVTDICGIIKSSLDSDLEFGGTIAEVYGQKGKKTIGSSWGPPRVGSWISDRQPRP